MRTCRSYMQCWVKRRFDFNALEPYDYLHINQPVWTYWMYLLWRAQSEAGRHGDALASLLEAHRRFPEPNGPVMAKLCFYGLPEVRVARLHSDPLRS